MFNKRPHNRRSLFKYPLNTKTALTLAVFCVVLSCFTLPVSQGAELDIGVGYDIGITLASGISATAISLTVSDGSRLPSFGAIFIDDEEIVYSVRSGNILSGLSRGSNNTAPAAHQTGDIVYIKSVTLTDQTTTTPGSGEGSGSFGNAFAPGAPIISEVRTRTSLIPGKNEKIQTIFTWTTNKPSTSRVYFEEGISSRETLANSTEIDADLVTSHVVITTSFKPATVYRFRVESMDVFQDRTVSKDYTLLTPREKRTVLDLIIENFSQIFGFLQKLR